MADPRRWYSAALKAAESLPQNFGTAEQFAAMLQKYGAKQSELNHLKVPDFLSQFKSRVPKQALVDYIDENKVLPTEVVKSGAPDLDKLADSEAFWDLAQVIDDDLPYFADMQSNQRRELLRSRPQLANDVSQGMMELNAGDRPNITNLFGNAPKYSDYATYPSSGYKETLVTLPGSRILKNQKEAEEAVRNGSRLVTSSGGEIIENPLYQSSHWDEPNVLFHLRSSAPDGYEMNDLLGGDRDLSGVPFLEELQSDWGQAGRKQGFKLSSEQIDDKRMAFLDRKLKAKEIIDSYGENAFQNRALKDDPVFMEAVKEFNDAGDALNYHTQSRNSTLVNSAPLVTNTNDWSAAGIRRFLLDAAEQDAPEIAWTTGAQQSARYQGHAPEGMSGYYDKIVPSLLSKYLKPYGGSVKLATPPQPGGLSNDAAGFIIKDPGAPHTATLPPALREKLRKDGIPFFRKGGLIDHYWRNQQTA